MKFVSWRFRPGLVDEERICDMRTGRPVRVARIRREMRWRWPVKLRGAWSASSRAIVGSSVAVFAGVVVCDGNFFWPSFNVDKITLA